MDFGYDILILIQHDYLYIHENEHEYNILLLLHESITCGYIRRFHSSILLIYSLWLLGRLDSHLEQIHPELLQYRVACGRGRSK